MTEENAESPPPAPPAEPPRSYVAENAEVARGFTNAPISGALFAANLGVYFAQVYLAGDVRYLATKPLPQHIMRLLGANASIWTVGDNRFETLVTSCFLHGSILHLAMNLFLLWQIGPLLERAIGSARFFPLYLASGIAGSAASAIWGRFSIPTLGFGASGALCGVVAAALVVGVRTEGWKSELTVHMARWLGIILLIGLVRTFYDVSQFDNAAHLGGAIGGIVVAITWERGYTYSKATERRILAGCVAVILASSGVVYMRNKTDPYVFMDVEGRLKSAWSAFGAGRCDEAREAMQRAIQLDPSNRSIRAGAEEIERECADPSSSRPTPRLRQ